MNVKTQGTFHMQEAVAELQSAGLPLKGWVSDSGISRHFPGHQFGGLAEALMTQARQKHHLLPKTTKHIHKKSALTEGYSSVHSSDPFGR